MPEKVSVKYIGFSKEVINRFGIFKKGVVVKVDHDVAMILLKSGKEFVGVEEKVKEIK